MRPTALRSSLPRVCVALLLLVAAGCRFPETASAREARQRAIETQHEQVRALRNLVRSVISGVDSIGRRAAEASETPSERLATIAFRQRVAQDALNALSTDPPLLGLLDVWAMTLQYRALVADGLENSPRLSDLRAPMDALLADVESEMQTILADRFVDAKAAIEKFAADRPVQEGFVRTGVTRSMVDDPKTRGIFNWIPEFTLNPFDSVGAGLGESAQAIEAVSRTVDRFTDVASYLPTQIAWQIEALNYELEANSQLRTIALGFETTSASANRAVAVVEAIPTRVREEVVTALEQLDPKLAEVRATLADVRSASDSLAPTAQGFDAAARSFEAMAAQLDVTLKTFQDTYALLEGDPNAPPPPPDAPQAHPFDVREFDAAGRTMTEMAAQLQSTLHTFRELVGDPALSGRIDEAGTSAERTVTSIVWSIAGAALAFAAGLVILRLVYRRFSTRTDPRT